jgi:uncharacterized membrane protein YphA (DoxX/SURF4 family)
MKPEPNALTDTIAFLTFPAWYTAIYWIVLVASGVIAFSAWQREPRQRTLRSIGTWAMRVVLGTMWWQQSLWKIPPNDDGLTYWMQNMVDHAAIPLQAQLVSRVMLPHIAIFGPLIYALEALIGLSFILGIATRPFAFLGLLMAVNLLLGLYSAPGEWPWTYGYLVVLQMLFFIDPPGRSLGLEGRRLVG